MIPTWPTVFAALIAGLLAGGLGAIEFAQPMRAESSPTKAAAAPAEDPASDDSGADTASKNASPCEQQQWPYVKLNCFDRTAKAEADFEELAVKRADPAVALAKFKDGDASQTADADKTAKPQVAEQKPASDPATKADKEQPRAEAALAEKPDEAERSDAKPSAAKVKKQPAPKRRAKRQAPRERRFREAQLPHPRNLPPGARIYERRDGTLVYVRPPRGPAGYERLPPYGPYPRW